jgi:hypothetical protein
MRKSTGGAAILSISSMGAFESGINCQNRVGAA